MGIYVNTAAVLRIKLLGKDPHCDLCRYCVTPDNGTCQLWSAKSHPDYELRQDIDSTHCNYFDDGLEEP